MITTHVRRIHMTLSSPRLLSGTQLLVVLFALALAAAACSGSPDVEADDASAEAEDDATTGDDTTADDAEVDTTDDVAAEAETDAMGEDDAMGEEDTDETVTPTEEDETDGGVTAGSNLSSAELADALAVGTSDSFSLPFMYVTVEQDCDGCAPNMSLYYVPGEEKASILMLETAYIDGVAQSDFSAVDPVLQAGDPRRVAEQLTGTDATFGIDARSGAISSWSLNGNSVTMRCLQVDTRPVDMRTELCENSLIG